ncbi:hypothetical protein SAMN05661008_00176 [Alkalithermobacter thermoalcaliphilus JW-YL-7 = DSM 7308]|uniref:Abortive infection protein n=1 Tax=Alkalithermobacter thermoalcaliphilus JW-YL-7 = DSM 7308 TaxID=1121328 RepID=A0A150FTB3_CLOPD|nr:Abortive infection protein [[Clostridium] paradoxum JW-YL-7 = DSM 7308]SHK40259.1 hypothetical protein SAMN05661008_00176 [[Clostridium] paradoxum JW-YL-7 = DSM 7308]
MKKTIKSNLIYLFLACLFLTVGAFFQRKDLNLGLLITEYGIILIPAVLFSVLFKGDKTLKEFLRFNKIDLKTFISSLFIPLFAYPIAVLGNLIVIFILDVFGIKYFNYLPSASSSSEYLWFLVLLALTPGICEEVLFRGFFIRMNEERGFEFSVIYSSFLFALFHFNIFNFMGPFIIGIIYGYLTIKTNSIYPAIIGHSINNFIATTLLYVFSTNDPGVENVSLSAHQVLFQILFWLGVALISFIIIKFLFNIVQNNMENEDKKYEKSNILEYVPILICIIMYIYVAYSYIG